MGIVAKADRILPQSKQKAISLSFAPVQIVSSFNIVRQILNTYQVTTEYLGSCATNI